MQYEQLDRLAGNRHWSDLERDWLAAIERPEADPARLLPIIDAVVEAGETARAQTMAWMWLSTVKETKTPTEALQLGRALVLRLPDGEELRDEILSLYRQTHIERPDLESWIERSGLTSGKSVRRALRFLTTGLKLAVGTFLVHRTEDDAAEITEFDAQEDLVTIRTSRRGHTFEIAKLIEDYDIADENDFRVLSQLRPERLRELLAKDPTALATGILRCRGHRIDRDELKLMLVPRYLSAGKWSDWWARVRTGVKRSRNLRIEGRSPVFLIYDEVGRSLEEDIWASFAKVATPRAWLDLLERYLRTTKEQKTEPDTALLDRVQAALADHIERFTRHKDPASAFATALVIERVAADGLPVSTDAHGMALKMLEEAADPVGLAASVPDARLWPLAVACVEQVFPDRWPALLSDLILQAPAGQCDVLAKKVEGAGGADLLPSIVERATADPGRFTDAMLWVWKGPDVRTALPTPPLLEMLNIILGLVGPARHSTGKAAARDVGKMRARIRAGLASQGYARFRECLRELDSAMAQTVRRQLERAEGLGPRAQDDMLNILRRQFPDLYVTAKVAMWDDDAVLYYTQGGLRAREADRDELVNVKMRENAKAIGEAAAHGDLSENAEYKCALEERDLLRARLAQLNADMSLAHVLGPGDVPTDHVSIGQRITLRPTAGGEPVTVMIMGVGDSDLAAKTYSYQTPIARRILGKRIGDTVSLPLDGPEFEFKIERFESAIG